MNKERENEIIKILLEKKTISVKELSNRLFASLPSIRRDLASLEKKHLIRRTHGGAILDTSDISDTKIPFILRENEQSAAKVQIGKKAASLVSDNDVVMLDASTSAKSVIPFLQSKKNILIITSGLKTLEAAGERGIKTISTGGELLFSCMSLVGAEAYKTIENYTADILFFSCRGLSQSGLVTDFSLEENYIRKVMLKHAKKKVLLLSSSKIGETYMNTLCKLNDIDYLITDASPQDLNFEDIEII